MSEADRPAAGARLVWRWSQPDATSVCLFAHYDPHGIIDPHVLHTLRALRACGLRLCVISACGTLAAEQVAVLRGVADALILRDNAGLDFASWQAAMALGLTAGFSRVLLANDSVYGPLRPLAPLLAEAEGYDAWGMVESRERSWHLQSWFVSLSAAALAHPAVAAVFAAGFADMGKPDIIAEGELALGQALHASGLRCGAASRAHALPLAQRRWPVNRMHYDWFSLARSGAVPFLKVELLRDNPIRIPGTAAWEQALAGSDYPARLVRDHLRRIGRRGLVANEGVVKRAKRRIFALLVSSDRWRMLRAPWPSAP